MHPQKHPLFFLDEESTEKNELIIKIHKNLRTQEIMRLKKKWIKTLCKKLSTYHGLDIKRPSLCTVGLKQLRAFSHLIFFSLSFFSCSNRNMQEGPAAHSYKEMTMQMPL